MMNRAGRRSLGRALGLSIALAALAACTGPRFVANPESGIELRWPNGTASIAQAQAKAAALCDTLGGTSVLTAESMDRDETLARFACRRSRG